MRHVFLLAGILGGAIPLLAQSQNPPATVFDSVTITASLEETPADEVGVSLTVIHRDEIDARQSTEVADLLATVPGLSVVQSGSPGTVTSVFTRGANSNQTLVLWNGMVLNDPYFGGFDWAHLGTEGIERIEVVRGPLSTLYGSSALGGTVQILTGRQNGGRLNLEAGEDSYGRGAFSGGRTMGRVHVDLVGTYRTGEGQLPNDFYDRQDFVGRVEWQWENGSTLGLLTRLEDTELGIPRGGAVLTPLRRQESLSRDVTLPFQGLAGAWGIQAALSNTSVDFRFRDPESSFSLNDTDIDRLRGRASASRSFGESWRLGFGGDWQEEEVSNRSTFGVNLDGARQKTWATFAQARYQRQRLSFEASLRRDDHEAFGSEISPGAALVLDLGSQTWLRASYGEAFRAPALGELFFPFSGNPELQPETTESFELSLEHRRGPWKLLAAAFDNRYRNLVDFAPVTFDNFNVGRARSHGVEASVGYQRGLWRVAGNATYLDAEDETTEEELLRRPQKSASLWIAFQPQDWSFSLTGRYVGERADVDPITFGTTRNDDYTRFDLAVRWQIFPRLALQGRIENLADESYEEVLGFPAPDRTFIGGVALQF